MLKNKNVFTSLTDIENEITRYDKFPYKYVFNKLDRRSVLETVSVSSHIVRNHTKNDNMQNSKRSVIVTTYITKVVKGSCGSYRITNICTSRMYTGKEYTFFGVGQAVE